MTDKNERNAEMPGASALVQHKETATEAQSAALQMRVQASYAIAQRNPRDLAAVRWRILEDCKRPRFADVARYERPVGKKKVDREGGGYDWVPEYARGFSIRFAESAKIALGHVEDAEFVVYDDDEKRIVRIEVCDMQTNNKRGKDVVISKRVERTEMKTRWDGFGAQRKQVQIPPLERRTNSSGEAVYIYAASDDDVNTKQAALASKARRNLILDLVPRDILEDAEDEVAKTLKSAIKTDPNAARKVLIDSFAKLKISPDMLAEYMGKPVGDLVPDELYELRGLYQGIADAEFRWDDALAAKIGAPADGDNAPQAKRAAAASEKIKANAETLKSKAAQAREKQETKAQPAQAQEPPTGGDWKPE
jgi:hypothetical protein